MIRILIITFFSISTIGFSQSKLIFTYDSAGNQVKKVYCKTGNCEVLLKSANAKSVIEKVQSEKEIIEYKEFNNSISIFPNPTKGLLNLRWDSQYNDLISEIVVIDTASKVYSLNFVSDDSMIKLDLSYWPNGLYLVKFLFNDGNLITKKIIKK
ncbi:T9SS type A sorting domain-containing protein [Aquimarina intermedia]|nr:T9SS type A sorting domain-containing protein [Aquimarina intermedia]